MSEPTATLPAVPAETTLRSRGIFSLILVALGTAAGAFGGIYGTKIFESETKPKPETKKEEAVNKDQFSFSEAQQAGAGVKVEPVIRTPLKEKVWRSGRIAWDDDRIAHIFPPVEGMIHDVPVKLGQKIEANQVLVVLDSREIGQAKLEWVKAKAALAAEMSHAKWTTETMTNAAELVKLLGTEPTLPVVEKSLENKPIGDARQQLLGAYIRRNQTRAQVLAQRNSGGSVSETTARKNEADAEAAEAAYKAVLEEMKFESAHRIKGAELKLKEVQTAYDAANAKLLQLGLKQAELDKFDPAKDGATAALYPVRAPFAGIIVEKHAVKSERVGPTFQMFQLADPSSVWIQADVFENDLPLIRGLSASSKIWFRVPGIPEREAALFATGDHVDKTTRAITLTATATNQDRALKPGQFVEIGIETGEAAPVVNIPLSAVLRHENRAFVFLATGDDEFLRVDVELGRTADGRVEILGGLKVGQKVATAGVFSLKSELFKEMMVHE